jgi:hypothetical protein
LLHDDRLHVGQQLRDDVRATRDEQLRFCPDGVVVIGKQSTQALGHTALQVAIAARRRRSAHVRQAAEQRAAALAMLVGTRCFE